MEERRRGARAGGKAEGWVRNVNGEGWVRRGSEGFRGGVGDSPRGGLGRSSYGKALSSYAAVSHLLICKQTRRKQLET